MQSLFKDIARAAGGALIFTMPALMTEELWELGSSLARDRLLILLALSFPLLMFLSHYIYFGKEWSWPNDLRAVGLAYGIGIATSAFILVLFNVLDRDASLSELVGGLVLQTVPASIGALLSRNELGSAKSKIAKGNAFSAELGLMTVGALFLILHLAPTQEILFIAYRMTAGHSLVLVLTSLAFLFGCTYAVGAGGFGSAGERTRSLAPNLRFTAVGYLLALSISLYFLWTFGRLDGLSAGEAIQTGVVLAFPASLGAGAARLIL